jgi:signal transduction histidine kinase
VKVSLEKKMYWGFGLALLILIVVGVISYRSTAELIRANRQVAASDQVMTKIDAVLSQLTEAESAERAYVLTGEKAYLLAYRAASSRALQAVVGLRHLAPENSEQQRRLDELQPLVERRLALLDESVGRDGSKAAQEKVSAAEIEHGNLLMGRIRNVLEEMQAQEGKILLARSRGLEADARRTHFFIALAASVAFVLVATSALLIQRDMTRRRAAERSLRQLSGRLLRLQDEERRRIARELHDSTAQSLAALLMNLNLVHESAAALSSTSQRALEESFTLCKECSAEIRTLSYLLHPPLLDEMGLASALRWFGDGFSQRSKIQLDLQVSPIVGRLPKDIETTLFRIVQESLTNIHRHSGSPTAKIRVSRYTNHVTLEVEDHGRGLPAAILQKSSNGAWLGVGLAGMRERVEQLGGRLEIHSGSQGTQISVTVPLPREEA